MKPKILAIIPARGGSKGVPQKNMKNLAGKPLVWHAIEAAKKSGVFDKIIISTDDRKIAALGKKYGVSVPFMRPADLAKDTTPTLPVITHAVNWLKETENFLPDYTVILQPTAPLRQAFHIKEAVKLLVTSKADSVVSMSEVPGHHNPHWQFVVEESKRVKLFNGHSFQKIIKHRQDLPKTFTRNGAIYAFKTRLLFNSEPNFYGQDVRAYVMDEKYSTNIDSLEDFLIAEMKIKKL